MNDLKQKLMTAVTTLMLILTLGAAIFAQTNDEILAAANKNFNEAMNLFDQQTAESHRTAKEKFHTAAALFAVAGNKEIQALSLLFIGRILDDLSEKTDALKNYNQALMIFRSLADKKGEAITLSNIALIYSSLGEKQQALRFLRESLPLTLIIGDKTQQAVTLNNIGLIYSDLGDKQQALKFYNESLMIRRAIEDKLGEAVTLSNIGQVYSDLGDNQKALKFYSESLPLSRIVGNKTQEATTLNNMASVFLVLGDKQQALKFYDEALQLCRRIGYKVGEGRTLSNIGEIYSALGDEESALKFYNESLRLSRSVGDKTQEATTLNNIAGAYSDLGNAQQALKFLNESLSLRREVGDKSGEAATLSNIGKCYSDLGQRQQALRFYNDSLVLARIIGDKKQEAVTLSNIGNVYSALGDQQKGLQYFEAALPLRKVVGDREGQANTLDSLMVHWTNLKIPRFAVFYGKQSINVYQELRQNINTLDKETQKTYLKSIEKSYRYLADILIASGRIAEAEEVLAMLKEEEFFAYLRRDDKVAAELKGKISLSADERKAFEDYEKFADDITRRAAEFGVLEKKMNDLPQGAKLSNTDQAEYDRLKKDYDAAVTVFGKFLDDLKNQFSKDDVRVAKVESNTQNILRELKQPRTVIISTIAGEDRLNLIVTTTDIQRAHTVEIKAAVLNKLVVDFREAVKNPSVDPRPLGKKLYDTLFPAALQKDLDNIKADTIVWSLDGTLRYAPMAALWDGKNYLAERYTNAVLTLAVLGNLNQPRASRADWRALGVGVSKAFQNFSALPAVPQELCSVIRDPQKKDFCQTSGAKQAGVIDGLMLSDEEFTLQTFQNELGKVPVVHIASHFSLNAGDESDSYLLLGGGAERRFSLVSLKKKRLDKVELLTLSACNTAMTAGNNSSGVEVEGFGALAQQQGAKTVLASLWAVADDSTRDLMTEFYHQLETNPNVGKAEALRAAQLKLLSGKNAGGTESKNRGSQPVKLDDGKNAPIPFAKDANAPFAHPYYWSPFVLFGNWR